MQSHQGAQVSREKETEVTGRSVCISAFRSLLRLHSFTYYSRSLTIKISREQGRIGQDKIFVSRDHMSGAIVKAVLIKYRIEAKQSKRKKRILLRFNVESD